MKINYSLFLAISFALMSCTGNKYPQKILSRPDWEENSVNQGTTKIIIAAIHNLEGQFNSVQEELEYKTSFGSTRKSQVAVGGLSAIEGYLNIFKTRYPDQLLTVSTGHLFGKNSNEVKAIIDPIKNLSLDAVLYSDQELKNLHNQEIEKILFLNSNIIDIKTSLPYTPTSTSSELMYEIGGVKIGLIGVTLFSEEKKTINGLLYDDPVLSFLRSKQVLKSQGANVILIIAQIKNNCHGVKTTQVKSALSAKEYPLLCPDSYDPLLTFLKRLPSKSFDAVIVSGGPTLQAFYNGVPITQIQEGNLYLSTIEMTYDHPLSKINTTKTLLHPPLKLCHNFFKGSLDCYRDEFEENKILRKITDENDIGLISAQFMGIDVKTR